jgi:hypothetical protein
VFGRNYLIEGNEFYNNSGYGLHLYGCGPGIARYNYIHNNNTWGGSGAGGNGGGVVIATDTTGTVDFYYNVIANNPNEGAYISGNDSALNIYNNVWYGPDNVINFSGDSATKLFKNNIIQQSGTGVCVKKSSSTGFTANYNCYYQGSGNIYNLDGSIGSVWATYQAAMGEANGMAADPIFAAPATPDFHLKSNSPGINTGTNVGLTRDFEAKAVPQGGAVDIGAYEYNSSGMWFGY